MPLHPRRRETFDQQMDTRHRKPCEPDVAASSRSNNSSCSDRSARPTVSILRGFSWNTEKRPQMTTSSWKRELSIIAPHPTKPSAAVENIIYPKRCFCWSSEQGSRGPSRVKWHRCVLHRRAAASRCWSGSFHVPDVTAKRGIRLALCLRNVDVKLELSTEALWFIPLWSFLLCVLEPG